MTNPTNILNQNPILPPQAPTTPTVPVVPAVSAHASTDDQFTLNALASLLDRQSDYRIRMPEPPTYDGTRDSLVVDGWVRSVERFSDFHKWDDEKTFRFAVTLLRARADAWFRTMEVSGESITSWLELKRELVAFFKPDNSVRIARDKLRNLKQTSNILTYINEFMDLKLNIPGMNDEEATDRFIHGLSLSRMRSHIRQNDCTKLQDAIKSALSFDSSEYENYNYRPARRQQPQYVDDPMDIDMIDELNAMNFRNRRFNNNNQRSYNNRPSNRYNNNNRYSNNDTGNSNVTCYYCNKKGHIKSLCATRRADIRALDEKHQKQSRYKDFQ